MNAMERSNLVIAKVLRLAMEHGLSHWSLSFADLNLTEEYETHFYPCIRWLQDEGLIRVGEYARTMGGIANGNVMNIALTARGMALLGTAFEVDGRRETVGTAVEEATKGRVETYRIGEIIGGFFGGFTKSMGS